MCQHGTCFGETKKHQPVAAICGEDWPESIPRTVSGVPRVCWKHVQRARGQNNKVLLAHSLSTVHLKKFNTGLFKHRMPQD